MIIPTQELVGLFSPELPRLATMFRSLPNWGTYNTWLVPPHNYILWNRHGRSTLKIDSEQQGCIPKLNAKLNLNPSNWNETNCLLQKRMNQAEQRSSHCSLSNVQNCVLMECTVLCYIIFVLEFSSYSDVKIFNYYIILALIRVSQFFLLWLCHIEKCIGLHHKEELVVIKVLWFGPWIKINYLS